MRLEIKKFLLWGAYIYRRSFLVINIRCQSMNLLNYEYHMIKMKVWDTWGVVVTQTFIRDQEKTIFLTGFK